MLNFSKSNTPKVSSEEALRSVSDPAMRQFFQNNPDALEKFRRHQVDSQLGIGRPGTQEYGFSLGVDTNTTRSQTPESLIQQRTKLPHMGWNDVSPVKNHPLFIGLEDDAIFYFLHSLQNDVWHAQ
jgi:hypothetical protein